MNKTKPNELSLVFGAMADSIEQQLTEQRLPVPVNIGLLERLSQAVTILSVHGILPSRAVENSRRRLLKKITQSVRTYMEKDNHENQQSFG